MKLPMDSIIGFDETRSEEENYFYIREEEDASIIIQATLDYLHILYPDAVFPENNSSEETVNETKKRTP